MDKSATFRQLHVVNTQELQIRVAFASSDQNQVDQHFGRANRFVIYGLGGGRVQLLKIIEMNSQAMTHHQHNIEKRLNLLAGCCAVYTTAVGDVVVRQLWEHGIRVVRVTKGSLIQELLMKLKCELSRSNSPLQRQLTAPDLWEDEWDEQ